MAEQKLPKLVASAVFGRDNLKTQPLSPDSSPANLKTDRGLLFVRRSVRHPEILAEIERLQA